MSHSNKIPPRLTSEPGWSARESWRMFGIMSEFVEAAERLGNIRPAVSMFGSSRVAAGHPYFMLAEAMIPPGDLDLVQLIDEPKDVVTAIFDYYEKRGFEPSEAEREILLNL